MVHVWKKQPYRLGVFHYFEKVTVVKISPHKIPSKKNRVYALIIHFITKFYFLLMQLYRQIFTYENNTLSIEYSKNILVIRIDGLGDVVMSTAAFKSIRNKFPHAHITLLAGNHSREIVEVMTSFNEVIYFDAPWVIKGNKGKLKKLLKSINQLRNRKFDLAVDLRGDFRNNILMYCLNAKHRLGFNITGCDFLLTKVILCGSNHHPVNLCQCLIQFLNPHDKNNYDLSLDITDDDRKFANIFFRENNIHHQGQKNLVVMIHPGAKWFGRRWKSERFAQIADFLIEVFNAKVIIAGGPNDFNLTQNIKNLMKHEATITPNNIPLRHFLALLSKSDLFLGVDSGPMHMATALNVKVVAIFGPAQSQSIGPHGNRHIVVTEQKNYSCSPCPQTVCNVPNNCMEAVSVETVLTAVKKQLNTILSKRMHSF